MFILPGGFWYQKQEAVDGARKVIVMTHLAGMGYWQEF